MKYFIPGINNKRHQNAGGKANYDINTILQSIGYKALSWRTDYPIHLIKYLAELIYYVKILSKTTVEDTILLQWPDYTIRYPKFFLSILSKRPHIEILIHDINTLRKQYARSNKYERDYFMLAEKIIVHTEAMKDYMLSIGVKQENIRVLTSFDYLSNDNISDNIKWSNEIAFAGNLEKSVFLKYANKENFGNTITFNCYGRSKGVIGDICKYCGCFSPDNTASIQGSWGLVWDGESIDNCTGDLGEYMTFNSPHKLSLYLCAGLPVIIWKKAALANYIQEKNLGFCIESLKDIPSIIQNISPVEYEKILKAVHEEGLKIRNGEHLKTCLA